MDQKFNFGGTIGYGDLYLESLLRHLKVFRLQVILFDAAGAVRAHSGQGPGYCYMNGRGPNSCLLDLVTRLLAFLHFLPSVFNSTDFCSSTSCIVLDIELAGINVVKELPYFKNIKVQGYSVRPPKMCNLTKQAFWCPRNLQGIV